MSKELEAKADNERRLGLLIMENKAGPALAGAVTHLKAAAEAWAEAGWPRRKAECLMDLGRLHTKRGAHQEAAEAFDDAALILDTADNAEKEASDAHAGAGCALREIGRHQEAIDHLREALELSTKLNDLLRKAEHHMELAAALIAVGEAEGGTSAAEAALHTFTNYKKGQKRARCLELMGEAAAILERHDEAKEHFEASAAIHTELGRRFEATETLSRYADIESKRGAHDHALELIDRCLDIHKQDHNRAMMGTALRLKGMIHAAAGDDRAALRSYRQSQELCKALKDEEGEARALYMIGSLEHKQGDAVQALESLAKSLELARSCGNPKIVERILAARSKIQRKCDQQDAALETMHEWIEVLKDLGERQEQLRVLGSMAALHQERGALVEAEAHLRRLISVCKEEGDESERLYAHHGLAVLLSKRQEHREAAEHYRQALVGYRKFFGDDRTGDNNRLLSTLHYQYASELLREERGEEALQQFEAALGLADQDENQRARMLVGMGNARRLMGDEQAAKDCFDEAAALCEQQGDLRATSIIRKATNQSPG